MSGRTLVLGDWGRVVRDPIDLLRAAFFAGALIFAIRGELGGVANLLVAGGALLVARARIEVLPDMREQFTPHRYAGIFTVTMALGVAIGGIWEIFEYTSDMLFGSNLQLSNRDTVGDLIADTLGSATGGALLVAWTKYGWGSVRRVPGQSRYEETHA